MAIHGVTEAAFPDTLKRAVFFGEIASLFKGTSCEPSRRARRLCAKGAKRGCVGGRRQRVASTWRGRAVGQSPTAYPHPAGEGAAGGFHAAWSAPLPTHAGRGRAAMSRCSVGPGAARAPGLTEPRCLPAAGCAVCHGAPRRGAPGKPVHVMSFKTGGGGNKDPVGQQNQERGW